ncbi:spore germination protein [Paenibacillus sp. FJAT-27812]|uniref:spore germination protein n=1 Tax=Paenibacillus sp. FJAT-27812 TaxID=1684143 RepID=UPI0006A7EA02|nr:spore germination protein [Paenibacillus sp. FJAT-27812]
MSETVMETCQVIPSQLEQSRRQVEALLENCSDAAYIHFRLGGEIPGLFLYFNSLTNEERLNEIRLQMQKWDLSDPAKRSLLIEQEVTGFSSSGIDTFGEIMDQLTLDNSVLLVDGAAKAFIFSLSE